MQNFLNNQGINEKAPFPLPIHGVVLVLRHGGCSKDGAGDCSESGNSIVHWELRIDLQGSHENFLLFASGVRRAISAA